LGSFLINLVTNLWDIKNNIIN